MTNPAPLARRRLVEEVIDHLRSEISSGRLASGARLPPETRLTAQLGVSRTTLREAMIVLSHNGLVDVRQGDGTYVRSPRADQRQQPPRSLPQLLEAKRSILVGLVRLAAARRSDPEAGGLGQLTTALATAIEAGQDSGVRRAAAALEDAIIAAARSDVLADFARQVAESLDAAPRDPLESKSVSASADYLARAAQGVIDRDPESADRHIRLWLAGEASALAPELVRTEYVASESRRGPRISHARRPVSQEPTIDSD